MVWRAAVDSSERRHVPTRVRLLAHVNYCFVSVPGGLAVQSLLNRSGLIDIPCSSVWRNPRLTRRQSNADRWRTSPGGGPTARSSLEDAAYFISSVITLTSIMLLSQTQSPLLKLLKGTFYRLFIPRSASLYSSNGDVSKQKKWKREDCTHFFIEN